METYLLVISTLSLFFGGASAYDSCGGGKYCPYDNTYCCGNSLCCTYVWSLWYFWVGIVAGVILLISCISACICHVKKTNQRQVQTETVQIAAVPYQTEQQNPSYVTDTQPPQHHYQPPQQYGMVGSKLPPTEYAASSVNSPNSSQQAANPL